MECPRCHSSHFLGILAAYKFRKGYTTTYFCSACCLEFQVRNNKIVNAFDINDEGERCQLNLRSLLTPPQPGYATGT